MDDISPAPSPLAASDALTLSSEALTAAREHLETLSIAATILAAPGGPVEPDRLTTHQYAVHGYACSAGSALISNNCATALP